MKLAKNLFLRKYMLWNYSRHNSSSRNLYGIKMLFYLSPVRAQCGAFFGSPGTLSYSFGICRQIVDVIKVNLG